MSTCSVQWYHRPHAASNSLLFKPEQLAVAKLHAESTMRIDVEVVRGTGGCVTVPQACYEKLADWNNETHIEPKTKCWDMYKRFT